jgi:hypothetical protein
MLGLEAPHLVCLRDLGREGPPGLVYDHVQGASLERLLEKHQRLAPAAALRIAEGLGKGILFLHQRGLSYGELRPSNVLLDRRGKAKLADLGWSQVVEALEGENRASDTSLDQRQQEEVRALGSLLFLTLAGALPEQKTTDLAGMLAEVPATLSQTVSQALQGEFPSMEHLLQALQGLIKDPSVGSRKTAFEPLADRVLEATERPAPRVDGGGDLSGEGDEAPTKKPPRRRRSDLLLAVGGAKTIERPKISGLKVNVGKRSGPTVGQIVLMLLLGLGGVGALLYYSQERITEQIKVPERLPMRGARSTASGPVKPRPVLGEDATALGQRIMEETRLTQQVGLVQTLLKKFPDEAPEVLQKLISGGSFRLRGRLLPFLAPVDRSGDRRLEILRRVEDGGGWAVQLASSLAKDGHQAVLAKLFEDRKGATARIAMAASVRGKRDLSLELAVRFEEVFLAGQDGKRMSLLEQWVRASGGIQGPFLAWFGGPLLARASSREQRLDILTVLSSQEGSPRVAEQLLETVGRLGYGWDTEELESAFQAMAVHTAGEPALEARRKKLSRKLQGR